MEQNTSNNSSSTSPPSKRSKLQQEEISSITDATSNHASSSAMNLNQANVEHNQQPSNIANGANQNQSNNGIFNFILPSEEDPARPPTENPDPSSAGLANSRLEQVS